MKEVFRREFISRRKNFSQADVESRSQAAKGLLVRLPEFQQSKSISSYVSYENEVKTHDLIKESLAQGKKVSVPVIEDRDIYLSHLKSFEDLIPGTFNILEPKEKKLVNPAELDLIIVPGLGFDMDGNRLGFGRGYYDRILKETSDKTVRVALAFEWQLTESLPCNDWDEPVDIIVTEKRVIRVK